MKTTEDDKYYSWINKYGFFASAFPVEDVHNKKKIASGYIGKEEFKDLADFSNEFASSFFNSGVMFNGIFYSEEMTPTTVNPKTLGDIQLKDDVDSKYFLNCSLEKWTYLKDSKKVPRVKPNGEEYYYSEGSMAFSDRLDLPARTMLTSETSVNRSTHVIEDFKTKKLRLLTPVEAEGLNGFPDNWTDTGMPEKFRYFTMGNALVVPVITSIGNKLLEIL
ncbi:Modification methylase Sau3AI (Cytosine-specific methyltransferase Sau3AI) (M.Sau3AI) (fragment) [Acetoanaerobium sticklandii]|uniref:Modification methylase Sau3AI (Cytosine-specific methyltransferase Sau3AI) (M.Sau3AI) n=1 Tax=Acetoanaerobium sticklandii (strain ATCC 12662 / DSM 519 / JCM 1433 / CCUG 9281 / NCIMB 10654 / HF) TaxID=499177 RepID=E3PWX2_ACESD